MSEVTIKIPWKLIFGLGPHIVHRTPTSVDAFTSEICKGITPAPVVEGVENLPDNPAFVLAANHYQRKGLWILFPAAIMTQIVRQRYGPGDPPVRWMVTANWPRIKIGPLSFPSPGDILLPRVADALACYPVSFAGSNQAFTARSIRKILRDAPKANRPLGIFPEGVGGSAGVFSNPIPGVDRLLAHLAKNGMPVVPVCISEARGRLIFRIGKLVTTSALVKAPDAAALVLSRIQGLIKMQLHLDIDGLEGLFSKLHVIPELTFPKAQAEQMLLDMSEMEVDGKGWRFQLPVSWKGQTGNLDLSVTMTDVDVPEISVSGIPDLLAKIEEVAQSVSGSEEQKLLEEILSRPRPAPVDEKVREAKRLATLQAAAPVLEDLARVGYPITWITNLSACGKYEKAIPVLLEWLPKTEDTNVKVAIAAALQVTWLNKSAATVILHEFLKATADGPLKYTLGTCLGNLANPKIAGTLVEIALDKNHGNSRKGLISGLGKVKQLEVSNALIALLEDPNDREVRGQAIIALGKMREARAASVVKRFLNDAQPWVRREAAKALNRMGSNAS